MFTLLLQAAVAAASPAPAQEQPAPSQAPESVAAVVDRDFAKYDRDANGALDRAEFDHWMVALKARTDPAVEIKAPATRRWLAGAFTAVDGNRDRAVSKDELAGYFTLAARRLGYRDAG